MYHPGFYGIAGCRFVACSLKFNFGEDRVSRPFSFELTLHDSNGFNVNGPKLPGLRFLQRLTKAACIAVIFHSADGNVCPERPVFFRISELFEARIQLTRNIGEWLSA
jgi:hypothetical protein